MSLHRTTLGSMWENIDLKGNPCDQPVGVWVAGHQKNAVITLLIKSRTRIAATLHEKDVHAV